MLEFISESWAHLSRSNSSTLTPLDQQKLQHLVMTLEALKVVIINNSDTELQCMGHFKLLFTLLSGHNFTLVQKCALEVINNVTKNQECVNDIAANDIIVYLLLCLNTLKEHQYLIIETLYALMSSTKIVKDALSRGEFHIID